MRKKNGKKSSAIITCLGIMIVSMSACQNKQSQEIASNKGNLEEDSTNDTSKEAVAQVAENQSKSDKTESTKKYSVMNVDETVQYQTWESFGTSGAWWAQYVGTWDQPYGDGTVAVRDQIATYLFDPNEGIGLTSYRYNLGAGSADSGKGDIQQTPRRAESFETAPGVYDWTKDEGAYWFVKKATELGVEEVVLFSNSPLERLTINGLAHMSEKNTSNLEEENYDEFATYVYDVATHFVEDGIPVKYISPINEPQWDWLNGQEGCHYTSSEVVGLLKVFVEELKERTALSGVEITGPESGEWGGMTKTYLHAILQDDVLSNYFTTFDCHSYWSDASSKKSLKAWLNYTYPDVKLRTSEWCEMVNGKDYTMDSAYNMADVIAEDLTILDVVSWQNWVGVADGDYRDGLIYVNTDQKACRVTKRLWGYGNYSRYIHRGYVRVDMESKYSDIANLNPVAFTGVNESGEKELVMVFINREEAKEFVLNLNSENTYRSYEVYTTSEEYDLEKTAEGNYENQTVITLNGESIVTVILRENE